MNKEEVIIGSKSEIAKGEEKHIEKKTIYLNNVVNCEGSLVIEDCRIIYSSYENKTLINVKKEGSLILNNCEVICVGLLKDMLIAGAGKIIAKNCTFKARLNLWQHIEYRLKRDCTIAPFGEGDNIEKENCTYINMSSDNCQVEKERVALHQRLEILALIVVIILDVVLQKRAEHLAGIMGEDAFHKSVLTFYPWILVFAVSLICYHEIIWKQIIYRKKYINMNFSTGGRLLACTMWLVVIFLGSFASVKNYVMDNLTGTVKENIGEYEFTTNKLDKYSDETYWLKFDDKKFEVEKKYYDYYKDSNKEITIEYYEYSNILKSIQ